MGIKPTHSLKDDIIYKVNFRGLTKNDKAILKQFCGTYQGTALKTDDLTELGITADKFYPYRKLKRYQ